MEGYPSEPGSVSTHYPGGGVGNVGVVSPGHLFGFVDAHHLERDVPYDYVLPDYPGVILRVSQELRGSITVDYYDLAVVFQVVLFDEAACCQADVVGVLYQGGDSLYVGGQCLPAQAQGI